MKNAQDVHSDCRKRRRIRPETTIKRLKSCRKRPPFLTVFHRFRAVIRHSRLRNGLHRTGKRRRFRPFPSNNGVPYWHRIFAVYCLKTAVFIRLRLIYQHSNHLKFKENEWIKLKKYLLFVGLLDSNDLKWKRINELNKKILTVRWIVWFKWSKIKKEMN